MPTRSTSLPPPEIDERLVMPESGYEILDGEVVAVSPAHEPHGFAHARLCAVLAAYAAPGFRVAADMLTRTSALDDLAPDASVYPAARDPSTGGRQLEQLAFEVVSTETISHAGRKAEKLVARGVRRVFAIDVERRRALEWSQATAAWEILAGDAAIDDPALSLDLPIADLVAAADSDDSVARALLSKRNAVIGAAILEQAADAAAGASALAVLAVLDARGIAISADRRRIIAATRDPEVLARMLAAAATCADADAVVPTRAGAPRP
jgi:Uma2 family endonuclease